MKNGKYGQPTVTAISGRHRGRPYIRWEIASFKPQGSLLRMIETEDRLEALNPEPLNRETL
jgi:hypothetical protein